MGRGLLLAIAMLGTSGSWSFSPAQEPNGDQALRVFLDCDFFCDFDHFRRVVPFVDYMRDRRDAQVHVLVTVQRAGAGTEFTFAFIGLEEFAGSGDTLRYVSSQTNTTDEQRDGLVRTLKMGLMPFVAGTPIADRITIVYQVPSDQQQAMATPESDPWNFWVFRARGGGRFNGESQQSGWSVNGSLNANRTTDEWKININTFGRNSRSVFELNDSTKFINPSRNYGGDVFIVNSITDHWSVGATVGANSSTFINRDLRLNVDPAIEYNVFPYSESTRRQLTFLYRIGLSYYNYEETTIFGRDEETRPTSGFEIAYSVTQPWGVINASVNGFAFLHDLKRHRLDISGGFRVRIVRGLDFNASGNFSRIKDQIYLSATGISDEEILTRRRQQGTDFRYRLNFGLSYTFGSIFNNIVNPRMQGGGGGFFFF